MLQNIASLLTAFVIPPAGPLMLLLLGLLLVRRARIVGRLLVALSVVGLWLLCCNAVAVGLAQSLIPSYPAATPSRLQEQQVQAIIVLGGGVDHFAPEYGAAGSALSKQLSATSMARLRYGIFLAKQSHLPLGFTGGVGWANKGTDAAAEADLAARTAPEMGLTLRWIENKSRDTNENARLTYDLLAPSQIKKIAIVTNTWHMPRSIRAFETAGFQVVPAPMGYPQPVERGLLEWMPSAEGLRTSRQVLRETLGMMWATISAPLKSVFF